MWWSPSREGPHVEKEMPACPLLFLPGWNVDVMASAQAALWVQEAAHEAWGESKEKEAWVPVKLEGATTLPLDSLHGRNELTFEEIHFERVLGYSLTLH